MKFKQILCAVLCLALLCFGAVPAFAADTLTVSVRLVGDMAEITGSGCRSALYVAAIRIENPSGRACYLNQIAVSPDGSFSHTVSLAAEEESGTYTVTVMERGNAAKQATFYFWNGTAITKELNAAQTPAEHETVLRKYTEALQISGYTDADYTNAALVLSEQKSANGYGFAELITILQEIQTTFAALNACTEEEMQDFLLANGGRVLYDLSAYRVYQSLRAADKNEIHQQLTQHAPFADFSAFRAVFASVVAPYEAQIVKRKLNLSAELNLDVITVNGGGTLSRTNLVTLRVLDPAGGIANLNQIQAEADGSFSYTFSLQKDDPTGEYLICAYGRGLNEYAEYPVSYLSQGRRDEIAAAVNQTASASELQGVLGTHAAEMGLSGMSGARLENAALLLYEQKPTGGYSYDSLLTQFARLDGMLALVNQCDWTSLDALLQKEHSVLLYRNTMYASYAAMTEQAKRNKRCQAVMLNAPFATIQAFRAAFDAAMANGDAPENPGISIGSGGGGGGGIGGGGGGIGTSSVPNEVERTDPSESQIDSRPPFTDLDAVSWAKPSIDALYEMGVISPASDGRFRPLDSVTREEFVKLLTAAFDLLDETAVCAFEDVNGGAWYYPYLASAYQAGLVKGYEDNTFGVGRDISREEMCVLVYRTAQNQGYQLPNAGNLTFRDESEIAAYALEAVKRLQGLGVINGDENQEFRPRANTGRAEAAKVLYTLLTKVDK